MSNILYIGWFGLPETAAGIRVFQIAKLLRESGNNVAFLCLSQPGLKENQEIQYDGFKYIRKRQFESRVKNVVNIFCGVYDLKVIKEIIEIEKPDTVIVYNDKERLTSQIVSFCHKRGISVGADVTEWYEISRSRKWDRIVAKNVDYRIRKMDKKPDYILSISPYFTAYYKSIGCKNVIEIPPIMDCIETAINPTVRRVRHAVYAGSPAQKDLILPFLDAVAKRNEKQVDIIADIVGVSNEQVMALMKISAPEQKGIIAYGRIPHEKCIEIVKMADFSVLLRENLRYAKAGFSTKLSESLSLGVPVLCNSVGGADEIIQDGQNGIKVEGCNTNTIIAALDRIISLSDGEIDDLKRSALNTGKHLFDGSAYVAVLNDAVNGLI